jgi:hypothetical protein
MSITELKLMSHMTGRKQDYQIDDEVWIFFGDHKGEAVKGKIVAFLDLPYYNFRNFVIEIDVGIDLMLEVRDAFCMWPENPNQDENNIEDDCIGGSKSS